MSERSSHTETGRTGGGNTPPRDWKQLSRLFEQLPPHAIEAEVSLLGSMLIDPQVIGDIAGVVRSGDDFFKPANGAIFDAMLELYDDHGALDIVQLNQLLTDRDTLSSVGGLDYLVELASAVPSASNARHYARLVREKSSIRRLIDAAGDILHEAYHSPDDARAILEDAEQRIFRIAEQSEQAHAESLHELLLQTMKMIEDAEGKLVTGVPTGFHELDEITHGFQRGEMLILAARPSMGKTALALNIAEQMAMQDCPVAVFSLEMSRLQLVQRVLAARSGVDVRKLQRGMNTADQWRDLQHACGELMKAPLYIDDTPGLSLLQLRAKARRMVAKQEIQAVVIDYMQLMSSGRRAESRQMEISEISRGIKAMARELNVPVLCLSQLNRSPEQREGHRPRMSDLRESGSIEQDADVVMMLHREEYYHQGDPDWAEMNEEKAGLAELIITKQRNGPTGTLKLTWLSDSTRFRDHAPFALPGGYVEPAAPSSYHGHFSASVPTGPVKGFRDGGGPDNEDDELPI